MSERYEIRAATTADIDALAGLARHLDTVNLPDDPEAVERLLATSERSFSGQITDPCEREYVFVLRELESGRAVGTSMVIAQLGRRGAPYIYFDVRREEKYSATLDRHFVHTVLATTYSYDGPTEIGGLVVDPTYRKRKARLGTMISYVRFLLVALQRDDFQDQLLAELLPPLGPDGRSHLWEAVGRRFTGLDYRVADRLSRSNKEFIRGLFPDEIYATLLSDEARAVIGAVGEQTRGVEKLLCRIGFHYAERVDPFDGGPHFIAATDGVSVVAGSAPRPVELAEGAEAATGAAPCLVALKTPRAPYFRARQGLLSPEGAIVLPPREAGEMELSPGDPAWSVALR
ncbi:MAG: arginine N-succinyltransferase [Myxococcales bacterium]|nr:arginine N-succinyltransferase [Myxococcales bacterium]